MCKSVDSSGDIPFLSTNLSFNMTQFPRYRPMLDSTYLEVNGTYFKTKYIVTCPQNIVVDLISQSYYLFLSFLNTLCPTHLQFPRLTPYQPIWSSCTLATHLGRYHKMCTLRAHMGIDLQLQADHWLYLTALSQGSHCWEWGSQKIVWDVINTAHTNWQWSEAI